MDVERGGFFRSAKTILFTSVAALLIGAVVLLELPRAGDAPQSRVLSAPELVAAYQRVQPGLTRASQLARFGLDTAAANTQALSYLGVLERFMPRDSAAFDRLDGRVRDCIDARDRCTALVFRTSDPARAATAHSLFSTFGLGARAATDAPRVTLLIRNGRVAFKMMSPAMASVRSAKAQSTTRNMGAVAIAVRLVE